MIEMGDAPCEMDWLMKPLASRELTASPSQGLLRSLHFHHSRQQHRYSLASSMSVTEEEAPCTRPLTSMACRVKCACISQRRIFQTPPSLFVASKRYSVAKAGEESGSGGPSLKGWSCPQRQR